MNTFTQILSALQLVHVPDRNFNHPFGEYETDNKNKTVRSPVSHPDNLRLTEDKSIPVMTGEDINDWDYVGIYDNSRIESLTDCDLVQIENEKLNIDKYRKIKHFWVKKSEKREGQYMSISEISLKFNGVKGYSKRSVATYIAAINRAHSDH